MRSVMEFPRLSREERDRRWTTVRQSMAEKGLDCLFLCGWPSMWDFNIANARYLCPVGGNSACNLFVFPLEDEPACAPIQD